MLQNQFLRALSFYLRAATAVGNLDWFSEGKKKFAAEYRNKSS